MKFSKSIVLFLAIISISFFAFGQTAKPKPKTKKPPTVYPTPIPSNQVEIVNTANSQNVQPQENTEVTQPQPTPTNDETLEDKIDRLNKKLKDISTRIGTIESNQKAELDDKQKKLLLNLDILTRAEQRSESLRKQLFEIIEKENEVKQKLNDLEYQSRPEVIERNMALVGSLRPEDLREQRRKSLENDKTNMRALLTQIQTTRANLEDSTVKADALVEKLRFKLEKEIDDALSDEPKK